MVRQDSFEAALEVHEVDFEAGTVWMADRTTGRHHAMALSEVADIARSGRTVAGQIVGRFRHRGRMVELV